MVLSEKAYTCIEPNTNTREPQGSHHFSYAHSLVPVQFELTYVLIQNLSENRIICLCQPSATRLII
jgi:hypothetical protein